MLTQEQHDFYNEHGWLIVDKLISDERIAELRTALHEILEGQAPGKARGAGEKERTDGTLVSVVNQAYRAHPVFEAHIYQPKITTIASELMNDPIVRLWHDQAIFKRPKVGGGISWHQDYGYWQHVAPADMVTCWLALDDCDEENGCMMMIDRSYHWGLQDVPVHFLDGDLETALEALPEPYRSEARMVPMKMKAGQASFHHPLTFHGSYSNTSDRPRHCAITHFLNGHSRYVQAKDPAERGQGHEVSVEDGEVISGPKFPTVFDHGPVAPTHNLATSV